jgi:hypothetical protein
MSTLVSTQARKRPFQSSARRRLIDAWRSARKVLMNRRWSDSSSSSFDSK